jgi:hypothetical protein
MAPLGLALLLLVLLDQEAEADASLGRRREGVRGRHELLLLRRWCGNQGLGAHDNHLPLRSVVLGHAVEEAAGGAVFAVPARLVHAGPPRRGRLGVAEREVQPVPHHLLHRSTNAHRKWVRTPNHCNLRLTVSEKKFVHVL